ncbi:hypothetical protein J2M53_09920 [Arthrobacter sp. zg-ZUI100]|uniref:hypothetical protein n=1 Tax=Arthrobacter jiangjiafuii TaxID=2817475 RepID=UPI001AED9DC5|nr:hypothetical protein [Arthrobacter jiangjiafuii]MBP3036566.1 hypothetical protein [Arthrobacter jiangjiafuii]
MNDEEHPVPWDERPAKAALTEEDLFLGQKSVRIMKLVYAAGILVCGGLAILVFSSVPWDTRLPYSGQFGRNGIPMPIAMLAVFVPLLGLWRSTTKADAHQMRKPSRLTAYIVGTGMMLVFVGAQWAMGHAILVEGGALPA